MAVDINKTPFSNAMHERKQTKLLPSKKRQIRISHVFGSNGQNFWMSTRMRDRRKSIEMSQSRQ